MFDLFASFLYFWDFILRKLLPKLVETAGWFFAQNDGHEIVGPDDGGANVSFLSPGIPARNPGHDSKRWTNWNEKHMLDIFLDIGGNIFLPNFCVQKFRFWVSKVTADPPKMVAMSRLGVAPSQDSSDHQDYYMFSRESL